MRDRSLSLRQFFANYVTARGRARDPRLRQAFAAVKRETFTGPGPWSINVPGAGYITTPDDDLAFVYQDSLVALDAARGINIGQPSAHARWLDALGLREGETVLQAEVFARGDAKNVRSFRTDAPISHLLARRRGMVVVDGGTVGMTRSARREPEPRP